MGSVKIEIPVDEDAATRLADPHRREAVGRLISRLLRPTGEHNPLADLLDATSREAESAGLTEHEVEAELAARKADSVRRGWLFSTPASS